MTSPSLSAVVPVYNSRETLPTLVERLSAVLSSAGSEYEIILVNDGSRDDSWSRIRELSEANPRVRGIEMMRNYGQHNAVLAGIRAARHEVIVTLDDDLQHPPEEIPKLLEKLAEGHDVAYGYPERRRHGLWRNLMSVVYRVILEKAMKARIARFASPFRAFRSSLRAAFVNYRSSFVYVDVLLTWATSRFSSMPVRHDAREVGFSNYTLKKLVVHALDVLTSFTTWPLRLASVLGFSFTVFGVLVLIYVVGRFLLEGGSVPGFPFLASTIAIFAGVQLFALGIIGEYMARMHHRLMERPPYAIRSRTFED